MRLHEIRRALHRARWPILAMALTYAVSVGTGMAMAHAGSTRALDHRAGWWRGPRHRIRRPAYSSDRLIWGYPVEALGDVARVYVLIVPLFFIASLWEFLNRWV